MNTDALTVATEMNQETAQKKIWVKPEISVLEIKNSATPTGTDNFTYS